MTIMWTDKEEKEMRKKLETLYTHVTRWNIWRKAMYGNPIYKLAVLFKLKYSPSMEFVLTPKERSRML